MAVAIEKIPWNGWPNCYRMSNGEVDLIVTSDIGPRVMRYGFAGGQNFFRVFEDQAGKSGERDWQLRGGHRVWLAPEDRARTYAPDNDPAEIEVNGDTLTATQPIEPLTGLRKQLIVTLAMSGTCVKVNHRMQNTLPEPVTLSVWALTMLERDGIGVTGFPPRARHEDVLSPTNPLVMWAFTDLRDKRWTFLEKYLVLRQDRHNPSPTKLGHFNTNTWGAYLLHGEMFLKRYQADPAALYPDMGCSYETFASANMLEIETLGPLTTIGQNQWIEHIEYWNLHRDIHVKEWTDDSLDALFARLRASKL
jgi:hypothetical protein